MHYVRLVAAGPGGGRGGGLAAFYEGVSLTIGRAVVLGATKMVTYNETKDFLKRSPGHGDPSKRPAAWQAAFPGLHSWRDDDWRHFGHAQPPTLLGRIGLVFATSVVAGLAITITTSPLTNARTHLMCNPGKFRGLADAMWYVGAEFGPLGYFRGFAAQWARFGPYAVVQFMCWEQLRHWSGLPGI
jgi:solute carrier family 25 protein 14/30